MNCVHVTVSLMLRFKEVLNWSIQTDVPVTFVFTAKSCWICLTSLPLAHAARYNEKHILMFVDQSLVAKENTMMFS